MRSMQLYQVANRLREGRTSAAAARARLEALRPEEAASDVGTDTEYTPGDEDGA